MTRRIANHKVEKCFDFRKMTEKLIRYITTILLHGFLKVIVIVLGIFCAMLMFRLDPTISSGAFEGKILTTAIILGLLHSIKSLVCYLMLIPLDFPSFLLFEIVEIFVVSILYVIGSIIFICESETLLTKIGIVGLFNTAFYITSGYLKYNTLRKRKLVKKN